MRVGYAKIGRSMPLDINSCGNLGGDVEMIPIIKTLAERNPDVTFVLVGRNSGERPTDVGLPPNVENPWIEWGPELLDRRRAAGLNRPNLTVEQHIATQRIFDDLTRDTISELNGHITWVGQHGTTNMPLPGIRNPGELTKPHDWCAYYVSYIIRGINAWRDVDPHGREEVYLNADPRNNLKLRDLRWPLSHPVLTQFNFTGRIKHDRSVDPDSTPASFGYRSEDGVELIEPGLWRSSVRNEYSRLEVCALVPGTPFGDLVRFNPEWSFRSNFGVFINETRRYVSEATRRVNLVRDWVLPLNPTWVHGTWSEESQDVLGLRITPVAPVNYFTVFPTVRCTFTTPASGTGWATAKPWEAFAAGVVCFFHPLYDTQNNILGDAPDYLRDWLRVPDVATLAARVQHLGTTSGRADWETLVAAQRAHFDRAVAEQRHIKLVEERLWY